MGILFHKMHGLGNDFVVLDARGESGADVASDQPPLSANRNALFHPREVRLIADRRLGVGCDQLLVLRDSANADVYMEIYNADGGRVAACGNATRCIGWWLMQERDTLHAQIETDAGILDCHRRDGDRITVDMGMPRWNWQDIPMAEECDTLHVPHGVVGISAGVAVNMGNPHLVIFEDELSAIPWPEAGRMLESSPLFPEGANITLAQIDSPSHIIMKTWERGAGETRACGTAACATMVAARRRELVHPTATLQLPGGELEMEWYGHNGDADQPVRMTGAVAYVFRGEIPAFAWQGEVA